MNIIMKIILNYWWIIIIIGVLILMTIIGYYADTKHLVTVKPKKEKKKKVKQPEKIVEPVTNQADIKEPIKKEVNVEPQSITNNQPPMPTFNIDDLSKNEQQFELFEDEFEKVIPEKPLISDELKKYMDEFQIKPMSIPEQKKEVSTNIELPKINKMEEEKDIWDF